MPHFSQPGIEEYNSSGLPALCREALQPTARDCSDSEEEPEQPPAPPSQDQLDPQLFAPTGDIYRQTFILFDNF